MEAIKTFFEDLPSSIEHDPVLYGAIAGGITGWMVLVLSVFGIIIWALRRRKRKKEEWLEQNYALLAARVNEESPI